MRRRLNSEQLGHVQVRAPSRGGGGRSPGTGTRSVPGARAISRAREGQKEARDRNTKKKSRKTRLSKKKREEDPRQLLAT